MKTKTKDKKKIGKRILKILIIALMIIAILTGIFAVVNVIGIKSNKNFASSVGKTEYESQLVTSKTDIIPSQPTEILKLCSLPTCISAADL